MMEKGLMDGAYPDGQGPPAGGGGMGGGMGDAFAPPGAEQELVECATCGRRMNPRALQAHAKACGAPKRKKFDSTKARVKGTEVHESVENVENWVEPTKPIFDLSCVPCASGSVLAMCVR